MNTTPPPDRRAAITGIGCRLPGEIHGPTQLWDALVDGRDLVDTIPPQRWAAMLEHLHPEQRPEMPFPAGVLANIETFDATYFGIGPAEAAEMDPQQRLLLEVVIEALIDAGIAPSSLAGRRVGVYVGAASFDHATLAFTPGRRVSMHTAGGAGMAVLANRISYCLDLRGPSITFDTACSASLVAAHYAHRDLADSEVELAVVAGANLLVNPSITASFIDGDVLSARGRCQTLDAEADGYVRSDGVGAVVLKPEAHATADTDRVYALITGSAINQDGRTPGLYAPSQTAQNDLLERVLADTDASADQVDYVELHGTGTKSGDRVEAHAIATALGAHRNAQNPLTVGSIKTVLGHTEGAAGVVGLIKTALMLHHSRLAPSLHHHTMRPALAELPLRVPTAIEPWPQHEHPPQAMVSAFGFGGTNACLVVESATPSPSETTANVTTEETDQDTDTGRAVLIPLSATSGHRLGLLANAWTPALSDADDLDAVAATAIHRRESHHTHRAAVIASTSREATEALTALAQNEPHSAVIGPHTAPAAPGPVVWVFAGHGSHHSAMAVRCYERFNAFAHRLDTAREALAPHLERAPWKPGEPITDFATAQHAIWLIQTAQAAQWRHWGYTPEAVVGHSIGEVAAAQVAGALTLEQAARLVALRSRLLARTAEDGGLLAVALPAKQAREALTAGGYGNALHVAAINSPHSTVLSGTENALDSMQAALEARGVQARRVADDVPAHSPIVDNAAEQLAAELGTFTPHPPRTPFYPTALSHQGFPLTPLDGDYWVEQMRQTVAFLPAIREIAATHPGATWVELAGRSTLAAGIQETLAQDPAAPPRVIAAGHRNQGDDTALLSQLAQLYTHDHPPQCWPWARQRPVGLPVAWHHGPDPTEGGPSPPSLQEAMSCGDHAAVVTALTRLVARILGWRPDEVDVHTPLEHMGLSSIAVLELRAQLRTQLHHPDLPADLPDPQATIAHLADALMRLASTSRPGPATSPGETTPQQSPPSRTGSRPSPLRPGPHPPSPSPSEPQSESASDDMTPTQRKILMNQPQPAHNGLPVTGNDEEVCFGDIRINTAKASPARAYDYVLDGKDNFAVDREVGEAFLQVPGASHLPWDNRAWLRRITRYLVGQAGIRQIIDLGSGLPTTSSIHTFAHEITPGVRVVYVDHDPMVLAHGRALLDGQNTTTVITGDVTDPAAILADADLTALIDLDQPFALLLASVLHHIPSPQDQTIAAALRAHLGPGCYLAIAGFHDPGDERARAIETALLEGGLGSGWVRPYPQHRRYFGDLDLVAPGLGPVNEWHPDEHTPTNSPAHHLYIGALAHKPT